MLSSFFPSAKLLHFNVISVYLQVSKAAMVNSGNFELYNALHHHMVNKRLLTKDLKNDMTLESMYNKQGLYINHYSNGVSFSFLQIHCVWNCVYMLF